MVPTFPLDPSALRTGRPLFPASIIEEPLTAYHGTSGQFGERIERDGLQADVMALQREDLAAVAHVFEQMRWCGVAWDGYAILRPFSLDFDYATADGRQRRVYLAETSFRAATYAGVGFAGGEAVRAVRLSLCDLQQYVDDPEVRKEHIRQQEVEAALTGQSVVEPSVAWVREQLAALERISRVCSDADAQHQYGIVYALRFDPAGFASLERHGGMGIISKTPISPDRIVAKVIIPRGLERPALCEDKERLKREDLWA